MHSYVRMGIRLLRLLIVLFLLLAIGCSSEDFDTFDQETFEESVPLLLIPDNPEIVTSVKCPTFEQSENTCTANISGTEVTFVVEGPDALGQINVVPEFGIIRATDIEQKVKTQLDSDLGISNQVTCSPNVRVAETGQIFSCMVTDPSGEDHFFMADIQDAQGNFHLRLDAGN